MLKIKVSDEWLKACGMQDLSGVWLSASLDQPRSMSRMGNCYEVTLPNGRRWAVFDCRGVEVREGE